eukprot:RCo006302
MPAVGHMFDLKRNANGAKYMEVFLQGIAVLRMPLTNKELAFTEEERSLLRLEGLLPSAMLTIAEQAEREYQGYRRQMSDLAKYKYLRRLQQRNEVLFHFLVAGHLQEMLPVIYVPTVIDDVAPQYSGLYSELSARGIVFSSANIHRARDIVHSFPLTDVRLVVATDCSAVLWAADCGIGAIGVTIGKSAVYSAGGISPFYCCPMAIDFGTDREELRNNPGYIGMAHPRLRGEAYHQAMDRVADAIQYHWPRAVVQWEGIS